jgi:alpha-L-arabinofuranosidase
MKANNTVEQNIVRLLTIFGFRKRHLRSSPFGVVASILFIVVSVRAEQAPAIAPQVFRLDPSHTAGEISPLLFGHNLEHTRRAVWQGLSAQMLANRKFAGASTTDRRASTSPKGFVGRMRIQGAPDPDGIAAHWYGIGNTWTNFYVDDEIAYAGRTAQRLDVLQEGRWGGVGQEGLDLLAGSRYEMRLVLRTHFGMKASLRLCDSTGRETYFQETSTWSGNEWHTWTTGWTATQSDPTARLEVTFEGPGTAWLGAASLMPADNFRGLRKDVIAALQEMSVPVLRWPGGNFTRDWKWKDDLQPVDRRPPVMSKNHESLPFTDNYDFQEIGIDDFMALCESLGAQPSLVLNITDDLQNACDLLEYCNGKADSGWGKVRAERGHPTPYAVKFWSVGNETFGLWMGPAYFPPEEYGQQVERFGAALRKIDPSIELVGSSVEGDYCRHIVAAVGKDLDLISAHNYVDVPESDSLVGPASFEIGRKATLELRDKIAGYRAEIDENAAPGARKLPITLDEWNIWHWWFVLPFEHEWHSGPLDGMYVASALNMFCRESQPLGLHSAMFFQPVNEGCIAVQPHAVHLTAAGQVFRLFRAHQGNLLVEIPRPETDEDVDICASLDRKRNVVVVTILNRNGTQDRPVQLQLAGWVAGAIEARLLIAVDLRDPDSVFEEKALKVARNGATLSLELPGYCIAQIEIGLGG